MSHQANPSLTPSPTLSWQRVVVYGSIGFFALAGWAVLVLMSADHVSTEGDFSALGPGMGVFDNLSTFFGDSAFFSSTSPWGEICRAVIAAASPSDQAWNWQQAVLAFGMWQVMAIAMMLPTAAPVISAYGDIRFAAVEKNIEAAPTSVFVAGYMLVWGALAVLATVVQWVMGNGEIALVSSMSETAPIVAGGIMVMAGLYQWSALKEACLSQCRSPMRYFMSHWQDGRAGALRMGVRHGLYCAGCCWALMALMFVGGAMNLLWMAGLMLIMLLEKVIPQGQVFARAMGVVIVCWGIVLALTGFGLLG